MTRQMEHDGDQTTTNFLWTRFTKYTSVNSIGRLSTSCV